MAGYIGSSAAVSTSGVERKKTFAITTSTTALTGVSYTPNFVHVFHNGIRLVDGTDYTATNGTSITLVNAAENGDEVVVVSYATFSPADAYTKAEADAEFLNDPASVITVSGSNVGIGTATPTTLFDVVSASNPSIKVRSNGGTVGNYAELTLQSYNNFSGSGQAFIRGLSSASGNSNTDLVFGTNASGFGAPVERMRITPYNLEVKDAGIRLTSKTSKIMWPDGGNDYDTFIGATNHFTAGYTSSDHSYWLDLRSKGGTHITLNTDGTRISGRNIHDHFTVWQKAPNSTDGRACFSVDNAGGTLFGAAGVGIDRGWGNYPSITIHRSSQNGDTNQAEFRIHGQTDEAGSWWGGAGGADFAVDLRIDGGTYYSSDRRRKTNIESVSNAIDTVMQIDGKRFQIINNAGEAQQNLSKSGYKLGFIAQDLENIIPDAVKYYADEDDGTEGYNNSYSVDYASIVALLTNAIKEQQTAIVSLETRLTALEVTP